MQRIARLVSSSAVGWLAAIPSVGLSVLCFWGCASFSAEPIRDQQPSSVPAAERSSTSAPPYGRSTCPSDQVETIPC